MFIITIIIINIIIIFAIKFKLFIHTYVHLQQGIGVVFIAILVSVQLTNAKH